MRRPLNIFVITSELDPYSKTGGLATVARSLSKALHRLGHKVVIATPFFEQAISAENFGISPAIPPAPLLLGDQKTVEVEFLKAELMPQLPVYFVKQTKYFGKRKELYGSSHENVRFALFDLACLHLLKLINFKPDVVQCHDWQSALVPFFLQKKLRFASDLFYQNIATVFTIHNLTFQFGHNWWEAPEETSDDGRRSLPSFDDPAFENINFAKRGILHSTLINTVSEKYAQEILTPELGQGLSRLLQNRGDRLFGIVNGVDYGDYNPASDKNLVANYDARNLGGKKENKRYLQKKFDLKADPNIPLVAMVSRITEQKGFDLVMEILEPLMRLDLQLVVLGTGEKRYENFFRSRQKRHKNKLSLHLEFDPARASQIYAAADIFLMPSRFEPCGLGQFESLRYGAIPVVHATGGLADTVTDFNPRTGRGNGFVFKHYDSRDLLVAMARALETYKHQEVWKKLVTQGMQKTFSWEIPARKYVTLFRKAVKITESLKH